MMHIFLLVSLVGIFWSSAAQASCYYPNGRDMNAVEPVVKYLPCVSGDEFSMCCATFDKCRPDGLCLSGYDGNIWRDGCTDPTWKSPSCIKLCDTGLGQYIAGKDRDLTTATFTVTPCNDGSFCCGNGTIGGSCCRQNQGLFVVNGSAMRINPVSFQGTSSTLSGTTSSSTKTKPKTSSAPASTASSLTLSISPGIAALTSSSSSGILSTSTSDASSTEKTKTSDKTGVIVGGTIGGVALLLLAVGAALLWKRWHNPANHQAGHELLAADEKRQGLSEAPANPRTQELDAVNPVLRHEAP